MTAHAAAFQPRQLVMAVRFLPPSQSHVEAIVDILGARDVFEIGDQGFFEHECADEQLAIVVKPLQPGGDPTEFSVLVQAPRIIFNEVEEPATTPEVSTDPLFPGHQDA